MYFRNIIIFHEKRNYVFKNRNYVFIKKYILFLQGCSSFLYLSYCQVFTKLLKTAENAPKSVSEYIEMLIEKGPTRVLFVLFLCPFAKSVRERNKQDNS